MSEEGEVLVGRCYTRSVKLPSVMGQFHGVRLLGGPYSIAQIVVMASALVLVGCSYPVWARFGLGVGGSLLLLVGVPAGAGLAVRGLQAGGQQLWVTVPGALGVLAGPRGKLGGRPLPRRRPGRALAGVCTVSDRASASVDVGPCAAAGVVEPGVGAVGPEPVSAVRAVDEAAGVGGRPVVLSGAAALLRRNEMRVGVR